MREYAGLNLPGPVARPRLSRPDEGAVFATTRGVMKRRRENDAVPQDECPIVKMVDVRKYLERVSEHALVLASRFHHAGLRESDEAGGVSSGVVIVAVNSQCVGRIWPV